MVELFESEYIAFDMYFASICSMQAHPGAGTKEHAKLTIDECRDMAYEMIKVRRRIKLLPDNDGRV